LIRALKSLPQKEVKRIAKKINSLEQNPVPKDSKNLMIQKAQILFLESTMVFYQNLFPRHSVAGHIARIQSDVAMQKREHSEKAEALPQADQQLLRLIEQ